LQFSKLHWFCISRFRFLLVFEFCNQFVELNQKAAYSSPNLNNPFRIWESLFSALVNFAFLKLFKVLIWLFWPISKIENFGSWLYFKKKKSLIWILKGLFIIEALYHKHSRFCCLLLEKTHYVDSSRHPFLGRSPEIFWIFRVQQSSGEVEQKIANNCLLCSTYIWQKIYKFFWHLISENLINKHEILEC